MKGSVGSHRPPGKKRASDREVLRWQKIMSRAGLSPGAVQSELQRSANLSKIEERTKARIEKAKLALEKVRSKNEELRKRYSGAWDSVTRYQLLREQGVDGSVLRRWEKLIAGNGLNPETVEDELLRIKDLGETRSKLEGDLEALRTELASAEARLRSAAGELNGLEAERSELLKSVDDMTVHFKEGLQAAVESAAVMIGEMRSRTQEDLQKLSEAARADLKAEADAAVAEVEEVKTKIEGAYEAALKTGRAIGKNEALGPLLKFVETGEGKAGEVIPIMSL